MKYQQLNCPYFLKMTVQINYLGFALQLCQLLNSRSHLGNVVLVTRPWNSTMRSLTVIYKALEGLCIMDTFFIFDNSFGVLTSILPLLTVGNFPIKLIDRYIDIRFNLLDCYIQMFFYVCQILKKSIITIKTRSMKTMMQMSTVKLNQ